ncbi:MAG: alpha/beta hydrolase, partial [Thermocrispum sp.]
MGDWATIAQWDADAMVAIGDELNAELKKLQGTEAELRDSATPREWNGEGAEAAARSLRGIEQGVQNRVAEYAALRTAVDDAAERIAQVKEAMSIAEDVAQANQLLIATDGAVRSQPFVDMHPDAVAARAAAIPMLQDQVAQIVKVGLDLDADLTTVMLAVTEGRITDEGATTLAAAAQAGAAAGESSMVEPPRNASPAENKAWWDTLPPSERARLLWERPELIGSRDGVPAADRDKANRMLLHKEKQGLSDKRAELQDRLDKGANSAAHQAWLEGRIAEIDGMLDGIGVLEKTLASTDGMPENQRHYLLHIEGDKAGQAIVALGNPDTASKTATYVPGMNTSLDRIGNDLSRIGAMHADAMNAGAKNTSVIMWAGYDAPQGLDQAMRETYADSAQDDFAGFQQGLRAT